MKAMDSFLLTLLNSATCAHLQHWQTKSYSKHKALRKYYENIIPLVDDLGESYMGVYGKVGSFEEDFHIEKDPVKYFRGLQTYVIDVRGDLPDDSELQNKIDEILELINRTVYRLEFLE